MHVNFNIVAHSYLYNSLTVILFQIFLRHIDTLVHYKFYGNLNF